MNYVEGYELIRRDLSLFLERYSWDPRQVGLENACMCVGELITVVSVICFVHFLEVEKLYD